MSISKNSLRSFDSSLQSGTRSANSKIISRVGAIFLAGLILSGGGGAKAGAAPYNVLVNPGAETGDLTGWNVSDTGYNLVVSTNDLVFGTTGNYLVHSGKYMFEQFDTTADSAYMYQDYPAAAGSQWSASTWAICYASNYFNSAFAYMSVAFYDTNDMLLGASFDPGFSIYGYGVYGSAVLDPNPVDAMPGVIIPPPAGDASGWLYLPATNFWHNYIGANTTNAPGTNIESGMAYFMPFPSTNLVAPPGTAFVRYQLEFDNSSTNGGAVYWDDCVLGKLNWSDPDITNPQPASVTCYPGEPALFTVLALKAQRGEVLTYQWQKNGTNLPPGGGVGHIQGGTINASLLFTNCQVSDAGSYACWVSDITTNTPHVTNSIRSVPATLSVINLGPPPCPINPLGHNVGFERAPLWSPWNIFNGCLFATKTNVYGTSTNKVNVYNGNWCAMVGANGDRDNGFWRSVPCTPGTIWKAGGWAYISSFNDFADGNTCRLMIWFKDADGNRVPGTPIYESFKMYGLAYTNADMQYTNIDTSSPYYGQVMYHDQLPRDQWCYLPVTNVVNNGGTGLGDDLPTNTLPDGSFMVPTNTTPPVAAINYQVYEYCPLFFDVPTPEYLGSAADAVYWDDMALIQMLPVTYLTASVSGTNVNLRISAEIGLNYTLLYKTNLTDPVWNVMMITNVPVSWQTNVIYNCDPNYPVTIVTDPIIGQNRFYKVLVQ